MPLTRSREVFDLGRNSGCVSFWNTFRVCFIILETFQISTLFNNCTLSKSVSFNLDSYQLAISAFYLDCEIFQSIITLQRTQFQMHPWFSRSLAPFPSVNLLQMPTPILFLLSSFMSLIKTVFPDPRFY